MQLDIANHCDIGGRELNEDTTLAKQTEGFTIAAVADGLGGHGGGKTASACAIQTLLEQEDRLRTMEEEALREVCARINDAVLAGQTTQVRMKTTLALALVSDKAIAFLHVGDSRAYLFREGKIAYQSQDHSVSQLAVQAGADTLSRRSQQGAPFAGEREQRNAGYPAAAGNALSRRCDPALHRWVLGVCDREGNARYPPARKERGRLDQTYEVTDQMARKEGQRQQLCGCRAGAKTGEGIALEVIP